MKEGLDLWSQGFKSLKLSTWKQAQKHMCGVQANIDVMKPGGVQVNIDVTKPVSFIDVYGFSSGQSKEINSLPPL